jgi:hypothetical protein
MEKRGSLIRQFREKEGGPLSGARDLIKTAYNDLEKHQGLLCPSEIWNLVARFSAHPEGLVDPSEIWNLAAHFSAYPEKLKNLTFDDILPLWVGRTARHELTTEVLEHYRPFLSEIDHLELLVPFLNAEISGQYTRMITDLGTIIDVNLIARNLKQSEGSHTYILELGGGYGRLTEAFLAIFENQVKYVMLDAVPESLVYAYLYLSKNFPDRRIGFYYCGHDFDLVTYDCYIVPTWRFEELNRYKFDVAINIDSMQEMTQQQIDYYLNLFDGVTKLGGEIYLSNSRDYQQKEFRYPKRWHLLFKRNSPRSWTPHHPVEVFEKGDRNYERANLHIETQYMSELSAAYQRDYQEKKEIISNMKSRNSKISERNRAAQARIKELAEEKRTAQARIRELEERTVWGRIRHRIGEVLQFSRRK